MSGAIPISRGDEPLMLTVEICFVNAHLGHLELKLCAKWVSIVT